MHGNTAERNAHTVNTSQNEDKYTPHPEFDAGWLSALGYIRNWIRIQHPKPNKALNDIIEEINAMQEESWPDRH